MISGSVEALDLDIALIVDEAFSPAARSSAIAEFAREQLAEARKKNREALGFVPDHSVTVDGLAGASEDQVRPDGVIVYQFDLMPEMFGFIIEQLRAHAPIKSGRYRDSFELFADGVLVDPAGNVPNASEYVFLSPLPYARKIEGTGSRPPESKQAPAGVFEAVAAIASDRFDNSAQIRFTFRAPLDDRLLTGKAATIAAFRVPAIVIIPR